MELRAVMELACGADISLTHRWHVTAGATCQIWKRYFSQDESGIEKISFCCQSSQYKHERNQIFMLPFLP